MLDRVQRQVQVLLASGLTSAGDHALIRKWSGLADKGWQDLITPDGRLNVDALTNFRRRQVLIHDLPGANVDGHPLRNRVVAWRRGTRRCLLQCLDILEARGYAPLLRRYPCDPSGNPHVFRHRGYSYTFRWARHVYFLGLLGQVLRRELEGRFVALDIGSSYGIFSGLFKREYPDSHHVLVDLPEQLILAQYFLGSYLPSCRVAGLEVLLDAPSITRDLIEEYDFLLVPTTLYSRLAPYAVDLVTNFSSFGEMSRRYFENYTRSAAFGSSRYLFTVNRVAAVPEHYDNDLTILDYPIWNTAKKLHFDICPVYSVDFLFKTRFIFFCSCVRPHPHFEYIGRI